MFSNGKPCFISIITGISFLILTFSLADKPFDTYKLFHCHGIKDRVCILASSTSGCVDHFVSTEKEAYELGRDIGETYGYIPVPKKDGYEEPKYDPEELPGIIPRDNQHNMDVYKVAFSYG